MVVVTGYLKKLMENAAVQFSVARRASKLFEQFGLVLNMDSKEETVKQADREEIASIAERAAQSGKAEGDSHTPSDW